jgi:VanZ family protein
MVDVPIPLMAPRRLAIAANLLYAVVLLTLGLTSDVSRFVPIPNVPDLVAHAAAYAVQSAFLYALLLPTCGRGRAALLAAFGATLYGGVIEASQLLQPARVFEARDLAANGVGAALTAVILFFATSRKSEGEGR